MGSRDKPRTVVEPMDILGPLGLLQYEQCFVVNLVKSPEETVPSHQNQNTPNVNVRNSSLTPRKKDSIPIKRLQRLEIEHLTQMNITSFRDQKRIMKKIRSILSRFGTTGHTSTQHEHPTTPQHNDPW
mmetsp:Transcript_34481/g.41600  ORF Transcript_34481/g.41600 Transcript_34481/m.41600 type:complete len:128 (-) Transcript_34481:1018-1401(-)